MEILVLLMVAGDSLADDCSVVTICRIIIQGYFLSSCLMQLVQTSHNQRLLNLSVTKATTLSHANYTIVIVHDQI